MCLHPESRKRNKERTKVLKRHGFAFSERQVKKAMKDTIKIADSNPESEKDSGMSVIAPIVRLSEQAEPRPMILLESMTKLEEYSA